MLFLYACVSCVIHDILYIIIASCFSFRWLGILCWCSHNSMGPQFGAQLDIVMFIIMAVLSSVSPIVYLFFIFLSYFYTNLSVRIGWHRELHGSRQHLSFGVTHPIDTLIILLRFFVFLCLRSVCRWRNKLNWIELFY